MLLHFFVMKKWHIAANLTIRLWDQQHNKLSATHTVFLHHKRIRDKKHSRCTQQRNTQLNPWSTCRLKDTSLTHSLTQLEANIVIILPTRKGSAASFPLNLLLSNWHWWSENGFRLSFTEHWCRPDTYFKIESWIEKVAYYQVLQHLTFEIIHYNAYTLQLFPWNFNIANLLNVQLFSFIILASTVLTCA